MIRPLVVPPEELQDPRFIAGVELLHGAGMLSFQIRYSDDKRPIVWMAIGEWSLDEDGHPVNGGGQQHYEATGALSPLRAVLRLCDLMIDGGTCRHCSRPTGVADNWQDQMPHSDEICWYVFDPELQKYRRSCEGS